MLRNSLLSALFISFALLIAACGSSDDNDTTSEIENEGEFQQMMIAAQGTEETSVYRGLNKFAELIEEKTTGQIIGEVYPNGQLGSLREQTESVQSGTVHMAQTDMQTMSSFVDSTAIFNLPYLLPTDWDEYYDIALEPELFEIVQSQMHENGFHLLGYPGLGFKAITTNTGPIHSPEDLNGVQIRIVPSEVLIKQYETWGAEPVPVDYSELYSALQTGVVSAQENPFESIYTSALHEVQDYMTVTNHAQQIQVIIVNKDWYDSLDSELQDALDEAGREAMEYQRELAKEEAEEFKKLIEAEGDLEVNELTEEEITVFRELSEPFYEEFAVSEYQIELLEAIQQRMNE